jgi:hypothetical protein
MSESFRGALEKVDFTKYVGQIEEELERAIADIGPGRGPQQVEAIQARLQELMRRQATQLAREVGFFGNPVMVYMTATCILTTAWVSFTLRRMISDLSKAPEERLAITEMLDSLGLGLQGVIDSAIRVADTYQMPGPGQGGTTKAEKSE